MLKRSLQVIRKWISNEQSNRVEVDSAEQCVSDDRRKFFKRAAVGAVSVTATAGLAKAVTESVPRPSMRERYVKDSLTGEEELMRREYVAMTEQEKLEMVQEFIDSYAENS
ncbi:MAG: hypothetical protein ABW162_07200 [Candidatus Sedimenticola sp. PURPLELP]